MGVEWDAQLSRWRSCSWCWLYFPPSFESFGDWKWTNYECHWKLTRRERCNTDVMCTCHPHPFGAREILVSSQGFPQHMRWTLEPFFWMIKGRPRRHIDSKPVGCKYQSYPRSPQLLTQSIFLALILLKLQSACLTAWLASLPVPQNEQMKRG